VYAKGFTIIRSKCTVPMIQGGLQLCQPAEAHAHGLPGEAYTGDPLVRDIRYRYGILCISPGYQQQVLTWSPSVTAGYSLSVQDIRYRILSFCPG
jgi:hypothetical protein